MDFLDEPILEAPAFYDIDSDVFFDPKDYFIGFEDGYESLYNNIMEATSQPVEKRNIFQRMWDFIKKTFRWIKENLKRLWNSVTGIFKKKTKSADQILDSIGVKQNKGASGNENEKIPASPKSNGAVPPADIKSILKPVIAKFDADGSLIIRRSEISDWYERNKRKRSKMIAVYMLSHPETIKKLKKNICDLADILQMSSIDEKDIIKTEKKNHKRNKGNPGYVSGKGG